MNLKVITFLTLAIALASEAVFIPAPAAQSETAKAWKELQRRGTETLDCGEYWIAEPKLLEALEKARTFGPDDIRLSKTLGELGRYYTVRGKFDIAEPYLEESLFVKERALGTYHDQMIPAIGQLVKFYLNFSSKAKADPFAEEILARLEGKMKEASAHARMKTKLQKGGVLEGWAGVAAPEARDPILEWAITCDELGNIYCTQGDLKMANKLFGAALDVKATVFGKFHLSLANSYESLGRVAMLKDDPKTAESYFVDSLDITEQILEPESHDVYMRIDRLAKCYIKQGKFSKAEQLYLRAQNLWNKEPSKYGDEQRAAFALGCMYADARNYGAAMPYLRKALHMAIQYNGPESINLVPYLRKIAYVNYYIGHKDQTDSLRARSDVISGIIK